MATNYAQQDANNKTIQEAKREYAAAQARGDTAGMQAAHAKAEAERAKSGYSGGTNGATYSSKPTSPTSSGSKKKSSNTGAYTIGTQAGNDAYNSLVNGTISAFMAKNIFKKHGLEELLKMIDSDAPDDVVKIKSIKEQINKDKEKLSVLSGIKADADELRDSFGKTSSKLNGDYDNRSFIKFNDDISILDDLDIQSFKKSVFDNPYVQKIYDYVVDLSPQAAYDYLLKEKKYYTNRADDIKEQVEKFGGKNSLFDDSLISGLRDTTDIISEIDNMIEHVSKQFADDAEFVTPFIKSKLDGDAIRNVLNELAFGGQTIRDDIGSGIYVNSPLINNANFDDETVDRFSELLSSNKREEAMDMLK